MTHRKNGLLSLFHRFLNNDRGSILILVGLGILFLVGIGGASIDLGVQQLMRVKLQGAADAAATSAAGLKAPSIVVTQAQRQAAGVRYFNLNYPDQFFGLPRPVPAVTVGATSVEVTGSGEIQTSFVSNFGISTLAASGNSLVNFASDITAQTSDIVLTLDISGSMGSTDAGPVFGDGYSRMQALKDNSKIFIDTVLASGNNRIAIVKWDDQLRGTMPFSNDAVALKAYIDALVPLNGTNSTTGLTAAMQMPFRNNVVKAVILMTDGSNSIAGPGYYSAGCNAASLAVCSTIKNNGAQIYTIAFGVELANGCKSLQPPTPGTQGYALYPTVSWYLCAADTPVPATPWQHFCDFVDPASFSPALNPVPNGLTGGHGPFQSTDPLNCPKPFLQQCASQPENFYNAPNGAALAAAFTAITTNIQAIRIVQ